MRQSSGQTPVTFHCGQWQSITPFTSTITSQTPPLAYLQPMSSRKLNGLSRNAMTCTCGGPPCMSLIPHCRTGKKLPRWNPRSRRGKFLGLSWKHASSVPLALNLDSGHISPQYHCIFDNWFTTVMGNATSQPDLESPMWKELFAGSRYQHPFDDTSPSTGPDWTEDHQELDRAWERQEYALPKMNMLMTRRIDINRSGH
jgi:hypothetical protein